MFEQLANSKSAHALVRQIALYCADLPHQTVLQKHLLNPGDVFRPLKEEEVSFYRGNRDCRKDQTICVLSSHVTFKSCKQGPQVFSPISPSPLFPSSASVV